MAGQILMYVRHLRRCMCMHYVRACMRAYVCACMCTNHDYTIVWWGEAHEAGYRQANVWQWAGQALCEAYQR